MNLQQLLDLTLAFLGGITPAIKEQQKIATVLTIADREIELLQTKLEALKQEKKALMQQLLTGKRRVNFKGGNDE